MSAELFLVCVPVQELREQQEALLSDHSSALSALNKDTHKLTSVQSELHAHRAGNNTHTHTHI